MESLKMSLALEYNGKPFNQVKNIHIHRYDAVMDCYILADDSVIKKEKGFAVAVNRVGGLSYHKRRQEDKK